ncbi:MAG: haloacid dehalogenase-like hydrolase [Deltaproteobacteria bacterium]|nr:haloacid dehalogenase-like hydrolase [Deltaproteobacteria bacterium]
MGTAVFIRVEGVLLRQSVLAAAAYFAANGRGFRERLTRLGQIAITAPIYGLLGQNDRTLANRLLYVSLRNMDEDRILELADEYYNDILKEALLEGGKDLLKQRRREGHRIVLISDGLAQVVVPLIQQLREVDDYICNCLEFRDGVATGRLLEPIVGGYDTACWAERYARQHDLDLSHSFAYATHGPDLLLLAAVGNPCAVNPDFTLRRAARQAEWPIMDYHV